MLYKFIFNMENRKAFESEMNRFDLLATRLENNLKNVTQALVDERNHIQGLNEVLSKEAGDLKTENVKLKAINGCLTHQQKIYEKQAFKNADQTIMARIMEAATMYSGDRAIEADSGHSTSQIRDPPASSSFNATANAAAADADAADDEIVELMDEDAVNGNQQ